MPSPKEVLYLAILAITYHWDVNEPHGSFMGWVKVALPKLLGFMYQYPKTPPHMDPYRLSENGGGTPSTSWCNGVLYLYRHVHHSTAILSLSVRPALDQHLWHVWPGNAEAENGWWHLWLRL